MKTYERLLLVLFLVTSLLGTACIVLSVILINEIYDYRGLIHTAQQNVNELEVSVNILEGRQQIICERAPEACKGLE